MFDIDIFLHTNIPIILRPIFLRLFNSHLDLTATAWPCGECAAAAPDNGSHGPDLLLLLYQIL